MWETGGLRKSLEIRQSLRNKYTWFTGCLQRYSGAITQERQGLPNAHGAVRIYDFYGMNINSKSCNGF